MTDHTAHEARDLADDADTKAHDIADDTANKAGDLADQARHAIDDTLATATAAWRDMDTDAALSSAQKFATDAFDKLSDAYKRNPALVITLGSLAVAAVTTIGTLIGKRR